MLPPLHNREYQDFLTLLTEFESILAAQSKENEQSQIKLKFQDLVKWFKQHINELSPEDLDTAIAPRWQSLQTEIKREFNLLSTDMFFLSAARQKATQVQRIKSISDRLAKLISYCQIMLNDSN